MRRLPFFLLLLLMPLSMAARITVNHLRVEGMTGEVLGLDTALPRFSWLIQAEEEKGVVQTAYQLLVASNESLLAQGRGDLWETGWVSSDAQLWLPYGGKPLKSQQHAYWKVRVKTTKGVSAWSSSQHFSIGLLGETDWRGRWIGLEHLMTDEEAGVTHSRLAARYLRKEFLVKKPVRRATAFVSGLGLYRLFINGERIGRDELTPLPSDYRKTIYYDTYDVTGICRDGIAAYGEPEGRRADGYGEPKGQRADGYGEPKGQRADGSGEAKGQRADGYGEPEGRKAGGSAKPEGRIAVGIVLGNGRFFAMRQDKPYKNTTFGLPKCRLNIVLEYEDGTSERLVTDETWRITTLGPVRANNEYDGEEYDARMELTGWTLPGYDDSHWMQAERSALPMGTLRGRVMEHIGIRPQTQPKNETKLQGRTTLQSGVGRLYDFGQNMAGWVSFVPKGKAGDTIRVRYAERLNADGTLYTANLRDARSEDVYVCNGHETDRWRPTFVTHGFRYVLVTGPAVDVAAEWVYDDLMDTGTFTCSDSILNKVVENARCGIASNYKGMPIDCPQRNERQPWLGDRTVGALGESFLFQNERLYTKWMRDIAEAQREDGCIPDVCPAYWNYYTDDVTWPAALPFICQMLYEQYGNQEALQRWHPVILRWIRHILDTYTSKDGLITKDKYGDWCVPPERLELIHSEDPARKTDGSLIATAYMIKILSMMATHDKQLSQRREALIAAFNRRFLHSRPGSSLRPGHPLYPDSTYYDNNTATANLLPLAFGICPDSLRSEVAKQVVKNIVADNKNHVSCGVIGISWLLRVLSENGYGDVAYALATQKTYPSWGYMAEQGATTIWELWNGDHADPKMNSGNHVMLLGDLLTWCFQQLGGIQQQGQGYRCLCLRPDFTIGSCDSVDCSYVTPYGRVTSRWKKTPQHLQWQVEVPCNASAELHFPDGTVEKVGSGRYEYSVKIPTRHPAILKDEHIRPGAPSCHAATIVETRKGDLVVAYFAGTYERHPDCSIYVNIKKRGSDSWGPAILAADGVVDGEKTACWNPVLTEMPDGELWLFYKVGKRVSDWRGWLVKSRDGGETWSVGEPLPVVTDTLVQTPTPLTQGANQTPNPLTQGSYLGPVKNKPLLLNDQLICGSSTEGSGWRFHVEILDLKTGQWHYIGPIESTVAVKTDDAQPHPIDCIQPSLLRLSDGRLKVLMRSHNGRLAQSTSSDGGLTWTPVTLSTVENNQSGTDAVTLADGRHALVYNNFETLLLTKKGPRTPLSLALSDDGETWRPWLTLEQSPTGEFSYPAIIQGRDGTLHIVYTYRRERIAYKQIKLR